ncbi:non-ribosomal peptide synthetase [Shouchella lonarensis]|uniref:Bacitracin synthase 3/tyrocidine synthetase-3 n=1 Tax=Shouchella lonarensis TaxID=1464122 RepID=A0A1G6M8I8_9BACI|nr:non-ribosomal peptide synthetase [Shouchella lonarensis]SDC51878.1 bacitracin synthase 3/tyrocidine synthetase-3 [Shouchella lonarensis]
MFKDSGKNKSYNMVNGIGNNYLSERQDKEDAKAYWRNYLSGFVEKSPISILTSSPENTQHNRKEDIIEFPEQLTRRIMKLARRNNVTLHTVLQCMWGVLLARYNQTDDVVFGTVIFGRDTKSVGIENKLASQINTIPTRIRFEKDQSFKDVIKNVQEEVLKGRTYHDMNLSEVQSLSKLKRELLDHILVFEEYAVDQNGFEGDKRYAGFISKETHVEEQPSYGFNILVFPGNHLVIKLIYNGNIYHDYIIACIKGHVQQVIEQVVQNEAQLLNDITILSEGERNNMLYKWNDTKAEYPRDKTIHQLFEEQSEKTPELAAVVCGNDKLSYREFNAKSNQLAGYLRERGVKADTIVAVMAERSPEMIIAIMGILKAGGAYLPIDPNYPEERIKYMFQDSGVEIILVDSGKKTSRFPLEVIQLNGDFSSFPADNLEPISGVDSLAYIIYTSGSTGKPKGVMITQRGLVNYIMWADHVYVRDEQLDFAFYSSIAFDLTITSIFTPLVSGNRVIVYQDTDDGEPLIRKVFRDKQAGVVKLTPSHLRLVKDMCASGSSIKRLIVGGEDLKTELAKEITAEFDGKIEIYNEYGPTEAVVGCMVYQYDVGRDLQSSVPIGKPAHNVHIYILNDRQELQPVGVAGELYISGDGVAKGYLNKPGLTSERFLPNPFFLGETMYRTGDIARMRPDGNIDFIGRKDDQVKVRGFRIEIGEVENKMRDISGIKDTVTIIKNDANDNQSIISYFIGELSSDQVKKYLGDVLPSYMIPSQCVKVDDFPLTSNGKVDREKLASISNETVFNYVSPTNYTEEKLVGIWNECFGTDVIGITDNFFDLGGHSLIATQICTRIYENFKTDIKISDILKAKRIDSLASLINEQLREENVSKIELLNGERREYEVLSYPQKRLWFLNQMENDPAVYNVIFEAEIKGNLNILILKQSIMNVILRHDMLRTNFIKKNNTPVQVIRSRTEGDCIYLHDKSLISDLDNDFILNLKNIESNYEFDLSEDSLARIHIISSSNLTNHIIVNFHHIVFDGWSMNIFFNEIMDNYENIIINKQCNQSRRDVKYTDYVRYQNNYLQSDSAQKQLNYWKEYLKGTSPKIDLPTDKPRPKKLSNSGNRYEFTISQELSDSLRRLSKENGCTLYTTLLTAFGILLYKYSSQEDIVIGTPVANRQYSRLEDIIGFFVNTLPIRSVVNDDDTFLGVLERMNKQLLESFSNQDVPFDKLVEEINPHRDLSMNPLFQVMFVFQNAYKMKYTNSDLELVINEVNNQKSKFDLSLLITEEDRGLACTIEYSTDLFIERTIKRIACNFIQLLDHITCDEYNRIKTLSIVSSDEMQEIKDYSGAPSTTESKKGGNSENIIDKFKKIVKEQPDAIALKYYEKEITYRELDERSDIVAMNLCRKEISQHSTPIGIHINRSHKMIIAILGVLKAGKKYLPLDPKVPYERLKFIVEDSMSSYMITDEELKENVESISNIHLLELDALENRLNNGYSHVVDSSLPSSSGYVIYTSGSTGKPKGVVISQKSLVELVNATCKIVSVERGKRVLQFASLGFDPSVLEIFSALLNGATLCISDNEDILPFNPLIKTINDLKITHVVLPPPVLKGMGPDDVPSVEVVISGGEPCTTEIVRRWSEKTNLFNAYGPTEATIMATVKHFDDNEVVKPTIGKPLNNTEVYVLDKNLNVAPIGVRGELYIGGRSLAEGYLNRHDLTIERFIEVDVFGHEKKLYRTGDMVKLLDNGELDYLGRNDNQVKLRGFRIELGEIEETINAVEGVQECVVVLQGHERNKYLVSYVVLNEGSLKNVEKAVKSQLPDYMVPSKFFPLSRIPLTLNGKVDVKSLPDPEISNQVKLPENDTEKVVKMIFEEMIGAEIKDTNESFFNLGGNSLLVTRTIGQIMELFEVEIMIEDFFENASVRSLSEFLLSNSDASQDIASTSETILQVIEMNEEEVELVLNN